MANASRPKAGTMADLQGTVWRMIRRVDALSRHPEAPPDRVLRCAHALSQLASAYKSVVEVTEIQQRLAALERATVERTGHL